MTDPPPHSVLIDTSVWIAYLRYHPAPELVRKVNELVLEERCFIVAPIRYEILVGARNEVVYDSLLERFSAVAELDLRRDVWEESCRLGYQLRGKGLTLPAMDVLIASAAIHYQVPLFHLDRHFTLIAKHAPLEVFHYA